MASEPRITQDHQDSRFLAALRRGAVLSDGATGSLLFELTGRLSERNHVYEALNIENPDLIRQVHLSHLQAGATALKTNTFGANDPVLARLGITGKTAEINRAAVKLARSSIETFAAQTPDADIDRFVLGSVGPVSGHVDVSDTYETQLRALISAGVDALLFETFDSLPFALEVVRFAASIADCPPIVLHVALRQQGEGGDWNIEPSDYIAQAAAAGASVIGVNCCAPWEAEEFMRRASETPEYRSGAVQLSAMPNAGGFERIGHRFMSRVNPEFMGRNSRTLVENGARLVGGCCEVHPEHVREMSAFLRSHDPATRSALSVPSTREPVGPDRKATNGPFSKKLFAGEFAVSVEMLPPRGTGPGLLRSKAELIQEIASSRLADAVDVTDGSRGIPLMPPGDFIQAVKEQSQDPNLGQRIELIPHFTARDLNLMGVQSRLIGYHARGIHNVLFVTGDPPKMSPSYPRSTAVFDLDSTRMIELANRGLNAGVDFGGQPLGRQKNPETHFTIGTGFEPESLDGKGELEKLERKLEVGADYVMTQPVFNWSALGQLENVRRRARIVVGVMVLTSLAHTERFAQVPGVQVPKSVFDLLGSYDDEQDQRKAGLDLAIEQAQRVKAEGWSGLYLMSPASAAAIPEVLSGFASG